MEKKRHNRLSIKITAAINTIIAISILTIVIVLGVYHLFKISLSSNYEKYAITVLENAYTITEEYSFGDMIASRQMPDGYEDMREVLNKVKGNSDIAYLYAVYFEDIDDIHSLTYAINTKTAEELAGGGKYTYLGTRCEEGSFEDDTIKTLQETIRKASHESDILQGHSDEYGDMLNGYKVIFDSSGNAVGLLCVEIDINDIHTELVQFVRPILIFASIFAAAIISLYLFKIESSFILPITSMTKAADDFVKNIGDQKAMDECVKEFEKIDIRSENEVGDLYRTISKMESDMAKQLYDIRQYADNTIKMQNGLMVLMSDMVETRDSDTGAHIQKTAEYVRIILEGLKRKGYYSDILTPEYIENVIRSAPLHDVGKIKIPDAILNKPGKLTDDEYEIMKTHSESGRKIIDKAISTIEGGSYLEEARNMVAYHHERWDGKGYPEHLHDSGIPLSARIMAVADVFDALTSPRVYKPAFSLSKSIAIIEEGKGTQFDPKCVEVFTEALPEIKKVLKSFNPDFDEGSLRDGDLNI